MLGLLRKLDFHEAAFWFSIAACAGVVLYFPGWPEDPEEGDSLTSLSMLTNAGHSDG
ncbi:MAG TPA: hypothetical protein VFU43_28195 [Streptosporangiaceae bacterium]|nr:hypothetical protein [Streptosporangiaceae bacterium]